MSRAVSSPVGIERLDAAGAARWNAYVESAPAATYCHLAQWRDVVESALGHETHYLYAESGGAIRGVLPLGHVRSPIFGNALISAPFLVYGGVLASDAAAERALVDAAVALGRELRVDYVELRQRTARGSDAPGKDLYVTFRKPIEADHDANMKAIPRKQRAMVRKGIQAGLVGEVDTGVERFFDLYSESVRNLGTPVLPKAWFARIKAAFGDRCEVVTICHEHRPISAVMSFRFRDEIAPYYGGGGEAARALKANDFMYWEVMRRAADVGVRLFDYGRSKRDTGSYHFKRNWGFEPEPLGYEYHLVRARTVPDVNPLNPKYRLMVGAWRRLPLWASRLIGPWVARQIG